MIKTVCVFASSSNELAEVYYDAASELGHLLGSNGMNVVYGGSRLGAMYACASSVKKAGGNITAVMPKKFYNAGVANPEDCSEFYLTEGIRERKAKMDELSDAVIALAGGFGTLEELSEMIVQKQLGYNTKPIIILNTNGFYDSLIEFFNNLIVQNFAAKDIENSYYIASSPYEAVNYLKSYDTSKACLLRQ